MKSQYGTADAETAQATSGRALASDWFVRENTGALPAWIVRPQGVKYVVYMTVDRNWIDFWFDRLAFSTERIMVQWGADRVITRFDVYPVKNV